MTPLSRAFLTSRAFGRCSHLSGLCLRFFFTAWPWWLSADRGPIIVDGLEVRGQVLGIPILGISTGCHLVIALANSVFVILSGVEAVTVSLIC